MKNSIKELTENESSIVYGGGAIRIIEETGILLASAFVPIAGLFIGIKLVLFLAKEKEA